MISNDHLFWHSKCAYIPSLLGALICTHSLPLPFGIPNILLSFRKRICPSPLRAPDHTTAWAAGFICDHWQFVTALSLSLRGYLQNILIISYKISILTTLLWTEIRGFWGENGCTESKPHRHWRHMLFLFIYLFYHLWYPLFFFSTVLQQ